MVKTFLVISLASALMFGATIRAIRALEAPADRPAFRPGVDVPTTLREALAECRESLPSFARATLERSPDGGIQLKADCRCHVEWESDGGLRYIAFTYSIDGGR